MKIEILVGKTPVLEGEGDEGKGRKIFIMAFKFRGHSPAHSHENVRGKPPRPPWEIMTGPLPESWKHSKRSRGKIPRASVTTLAA